MSEHYATVRTFGQHCYRLKTTLVFLVVCWGLLIFEYPADGQTIPRYWTALYAVAKLGIGICVAHLAVHELFPYLRLSALLEEYRAATQRRNGAMALAAAEAFKAGAVLVAIIMAVIIYALAIW